MRQLLALAVVISWTSVASAGGVVRARVGGTGNLGATPQLAAPGAGLVPSLSAGAGLNASLVPTALTLSAPQLAPAASLTPAAGAALSAPRLLPAPAAANDAPASKDGAAESRLPVLYRPGALVPVSGKSEAKAEGEAASSLLPVPVRELAVVASRQDDPAQARRAEQALALTYDGSRARSGDAGEAVPGGESQPLLLTDGRGQAPETAPSEAPPVPPAAPGPSPLKRAWDALPKVTALLIAANVLTYLIVGPADLGWVVFHGFDVDAARAAFSALDAGGMLGAAGRAFSAPFLHGDPASLLGNMAALAVFGTLAERARGSKSVAALYAAGLVGSQLLTALLAPHTLAFGSAGAIFGLVAAYVLSAQLRAALSAAREPRKLFTREGAPSLLLGLLGLAAAGLIGLDALGLFGAGPAAAAGVAAGTLGGALGGALVLLGGRLNEIRLRRRL